ncbi:virulence-associated E family protein [Acidiphilium sp. PA]|uniref:virulence-associated E family protein n=1 Tax=Acidiphilium sp. PA TaxID=2871705 RepID=UPI002243CA55|nr:virulence-associated E family protein [Acidiphilium sp. PA]
MDLNAAEILDHEFDDDDLVRQASAPMSPAKIAFRAMGIAYREGRTLDETIETLRKNERTSAYILRAQAAGGESLRRAWSKIEATSRSTPAPDWLRDCQTNLTNEPRNNLTNALIAMRRDPALRDLVAYNEMRREVMLMRPVPSTTLRAVTEPCSFADHHLAAVLEHIQRAGLPRMSADILSDAIDLRAHEQAFHPVRDYLTGLKWDGNPRLAFWLSEYLGTEASIYNERVGEMFLMGMVARIMRPGCQLDYAMVLEGPQGILKSSICTVLAGEFCGDQMPDLRNGGKDLSGFIRDKWLVEISEMAALDKADANLLKAFLTRRVEDYRPAYGRRTIKEPRQCVFVLTTNEAQYLRDATGNRRFWPVAVKSIDIDGLRQARDQLFAEAVHRFKAGEPYWPAADFEREHIADEQEARREVDAWSETVDRFVECRDRVSVHEISVEALHIPLKDLGTSHTRRITAILSQMGFEPSRNGKKRFWIRESRT